jgi:hypothetical protein
VLAYKAKLEAQKRVLHTAVCNSQLGFGFATNETNPAATSGFEYKHLLNVEFLRNNDSKSQEQTVVQTSRVQTLSHIQASVPRFELKIEATCSQRKMAAVKFTVRDVHCCVKINQI